MTKVPDLRLPDRKFGAWKPDRAEQYNMRYWKAKQAKPKPVKAPRINKPKKAKPVDRTLFNQQHDHLEHLKQIMRGQ